jgi:GLPGLI family protein
LPGLILELSKGRIIYYAKKIEIKKDNMRIEAPKKGKIVSESEFQNMVKG